MSNGEKKLGVFVKGPDGKVYRVTKTEVTSDDPDFAAIDNITSASPNKFIEIDENLSATEIGSAFDGDDQGTLDKM